MGLNLLKGKRVHEITVIGDSMVIIQTLLHRILPQTSFKPEYIRESSRWGENLIKSTSSMFFIFCSSAKGVDSHNHHMSPTMMCQSIKMGDPPCKMSLHEGGEKGEKLITISSLNSKYQIPIMQFPNDTL